MEHFDDIEINDSANTIAESVYTALREHLPPMLPHREQDLIRQVADAVYLKLRPVYKNADNLIEREIDDTQAMSEKLNEVMQRAKDAEKRLSEVSARMSEAMADVIDMLKKHNMEYGNTVSLSATYIKLSA